MRVLRAHTYWVAIHGGGAALVYRAGRRNRCTIATGRARSPRSLPRSWRIAHIHHACPLAVRAVGELLPTKPPTRRPPTTTGTTPTKPADPTDCAGKPRSATPDYAAMAACGFPTPATTGVPPGTSLTPITHAALPSGATWSTEYDELDITGNNVTISGVSIQGKIHITGVNDTVENSLVDSSDTQQPAILVYNGASNTTISHDELEAPSSQQGVINDGGRTPLVLENSYLHGNCTGALGVNMTVKDNYIISDTDPGGVCHDEAIYVPGGDDTATEPTVIEHNTLLNPFDQTAAVFLDDHAFGTNHNVTITDNLMAGGGYVTYGDQNGDGATNISITNNRYSRLYFSDGGHFGPDTLNRPATTWSGNVWDDTLKPVTAYSSDG